MKFHINGQRHELTLESASLLAAGIYVTYGELRERMSGNLRCCGANNGIIAAIRERHLA